MLANLGREMNGMLKKLDKDSKVLKDLNKVIDDKELQKLMKQLTAQQASMMKLMKTIEKKVNAKK